MSVGVGFGMWGLVHPSQGWQALQVRGTSVSKVPLMATARLLGLLKQAANDCHKRSRAATPKVEPPFRPDATANRTRARCDLLAESRDSPEEVRSIGQGSSRG